MTRNCKSICLALLLTVLAAENGISGIYPLPEFGTKLFYPEYWVAESGDQVRSLGARMHRQNPQEGILPVAVFHRKNNPNMGNTGHNFLGFMYSPASGAMTPELVITGMADVLQRHAGIVEASSGGSGIRFKNLTSKILHFDPRLNAVWCESTEESLDGPAVVRAYAIVTRAGILFAIAFADPDNSPVVMPEVQDIVSSLEIPAEIRVSPEWTKTAQAVLNQLKDGGRQPTKALPSNWNHPM